MEIVESREPVWAAGAGWRIGNTPELEIGVLEGSDEYVFGKVRSAWLLDTDRIVVADESAEEIRFYSRRGRFLKAAGRAGEGPGEFRNIWTVRPFRGDSVFVYDYSLGRVSIFDSEGRFGRVVPIRVAAPNYWVVGTIEDSLLVLKSPGETGPSRWPAGVSTDSTFLFAYRNAEATLDTLGRYALAIRYRGTGRAPEEGFFLPYASLALSGSRYFWGFGDKWQYGEYAPDGTLLRIVRRDRAEEELSEQRIARFKHDWPQQVAASAGSRSENSLMAMTAYVERGYFPQTVPAYSMLIADAAGNVWAEHYRHPVEPASEWSIFGPDGRWLGDLRMPDGLQVEQVGQDFVLGIHIDTLGTNYLRLYRLERRE